MNAARVLPLPVGAQSKTSTPLPIAGHPSSCAREGRPKRRSNQVRTAKWNSPITGFTTSVYITRPAAGSALPLGGENSREAIADLAPPPREFIEQPRCRVRALEPPPPCQRR